jgi:hypothetical protein
MYNCYTPFYKKSDGAAYTLPCGKCPQCIKRRISGWSFRLMEEEKQSSSSYFVTFTYDDNNIESSKRGLATLKKRDIQNYIKRLRKCHQQKLKYYYCGEYGSKTHRPHYHMIIFNAREDLIQKHWTLGQIHIGKVSEASVGYTLKYMCKEKKVPEHQNDDRQKEFSNMSKGLGLSYLTKNMVTWHKNDIVNRMYCNVEGNKKIAMPRIIKDKLYTQEERGRLKLHHTTLLQEHIDKENLDINFDIIQFNKHQSIVNEFRKQKQSSSTRGN